MEALIAILIFVGGAIWNAYQKRKLEQEEGKPFLPPAPRRGVGQPGQPPPPAQRPARNEPMNWEEQLRRLLEGEPAGGPPPVIVAEQRPATPPPLTGAPRFPSSRRAAPAPVVEFDESADIGLPVQMPKLTQSSQAWQRGNQLESTVAERLRQVDQRISEHRPLEMRKAVSLELQQAVEMVRHRSTLRTAIVASVVLGPPKALEL